MFLPFELPVHSPEVVKAIFHPKLEQKGSTLKKYDTPFSAQSVFPGLFLIEFLMVLKNTLSHSIENTVQRGLMLERLHRIMFPPERPYV